LPGGTTMTQIARVSLVSLSKNSGTRQVIDAAASKQGITLRHAVTVTQVTTMMSLVGPGLGVAIVPAGGIVGFNTDVLKTLPIINPTLSRNLVLVPL
jgi:DNA-binding transcriptional LysR family regulator